jgi:lambda family phage tail tape measure protein
VFNDFNKDTDKAGKNVDSFRLRTGGLDNFLKAGIGIGAFYGLIREAKLALDTVEQTGNAVRGLASTARYSGEDIGQSINAGMEIAEDGLVNVRDASQALQNLLSRGFSLKESIDIIDRLKDAAAFNRQASLSMSDAVKSATEGLKNENSILVDNAGVTKNVSVMWKEYALQHGKSVDKLTQAQKRQAEYNGIMRETEGQVGNAKLAIEGITGAKAQLSVEVFKLRNAFGEGETGLFYVLGNSIGWAFGKLREFLGGVEILAVKTAGFWDKLMVRKDIVLSGKGVFSKEGLDDYEKRVKSIREAEEAQIDEIVAKWEGKIKAPNIGADTGKRRKDTILPDDDKKAKKILEDGLKTLRELTAKNDAEALKTTDELAAKKATIAEKYFEYGKKFPMLRAQFEIQKAKEIANAENEVSIKRHEQWREDQEEAKKLAKEKEDLEREVSAVFQSELDTRLAAEDAWGKEKKERATSYADRAQKEVEIDAAVTEKKRKIQADFEMQRSEAEISYQLSLIDTQEKFHQISRGDANDRRLTLTEDLLRRHEQYANSIDRLRDKTAWILQQQAIQQTRDKLLELQKEYQRLNGTMNEGLREGIENYTRELPTAFEAMESAAEKTAQGMESTFSTVFDDLEHGKIKDLQSAFESFGNSVLNIFNDIMAKMTMASLMGEDSTKGWGSFFSKIAGGFGSGGGDNYNTEWLENAKGNVFSSPSLSQYSGSVVSKPTFFKFALGDALGVMGEGSDPEGIFPLARDPRTGKLGLRAIGGGERQASGGQDAVTPQVIAPQFHIYTLDTVTMEQWVYQHRELFAGAATSLAQDNHPIRRGR